MNRGKSGYERLTQRYRDMVDLIMRGEFLARDYVRSTAKSLGIAPRTAKNRMARIFMVYGIDCKRYHGAVRLVYLRSKELGLIG